MTAMAAIVDAARRPGVDVPGDKVWHPERISAGADGTSVAFVVPRTRSGEATCAGLWYGRPGNALERLSADAVATNIAVSPDGGTLAYGVTVDDRSALVVRSADGTERAHVELPGVAEIVRRVDDDTFYVSVAEPGADTASLSSGKPLSADAPLVRSNTEPIGWRRIWRVDVAHGSLEAVSPERLTVWSFELLPVGRVVAVAGDDPGEAGWYSASLMMLGPTPGERVDLHTPAWTIGAITVCPDAARVAFVEGWTSDRGLDTGDVFVLDLETGVVSPVPVDGVDVTSLRWGDDDRLWFAGWRGLGMAWGHVDRAGEATLHAVDASIVNARWHPEVVPLGNAALTVYSTEHMPPEVGWLRDDTVEVWSQLNADIERDRGFVVDEVRWRHGDTELDGLFVRPSGKAGMLPLVVDIHGGPSLAYHHAWDLTWAETVVPAGYALFLPNPVGGPGHGQSFGRANLHDPAGTEFDQVLSGVEALVEDGWVDRVRIAAIGASYGGYLTAWAVARGELFRGGVVIAGMSNLVSCWGTANNAPFYERVCGGTPAEAREMYVSRSPVSAVSGESLPALILHGELDQCVPVSQARELFATLTAASRPAELVVYPDEGHQIQSIGHLHDQRTRILNFLARVLR